MDKEKESGFKGFEIAEMKFEKDSSPCSKCILDSCGKRDCNLQVYRLGEERILAGGLCPKGNTNLEKKKALNYVSLYKKLLDKHLERVTIPLEEEVGKDSKRVFVPRSLSFFNECGVFYASLYDALGFKVSISPESDEDISNLGRERAHSESCYPVILAHGHAALLKKYLRQGEDKMLLVNVIGGEEEGYKSCPYVSSAGHVIRGNLGLSLDDVFMPVLYFNNPKYPVEKAIRKDLARVFGSRAFSERKVKGAVEFAHGKQKEFLEEVYSQGESIAKRVSEKGEALFIGIGRGYTLLDPKASSNVDEIFAREGLHFLPSLFFRNKKRDISKVAENMYWLQGQRIINYCLDVAENANYFSVRETNFNCGPDSLLLYHEEDIMKRAGKPALLLETDGHNSNAQFGTRILAFNEVIKQRGDKKDSFVLVSGRKEFGSLEERMIGVPYMGGNSDILAAAFRAVGLNAEVMPSGTDDSLHFAKKLVHTNTCQPFSFQVGDHFAWLYGFRKRGEDPNKSASVFLPKTDGPCRFGQYSVVLRKLFDANGFERVPLIDPGTNDGYGRVGSISSERMKGMSALIFRACFANDVLQNALLRTRVYEIDEGTSEGLYTNSHKELVGLVENRAGLKELKEFMCDKAKEFIRIRKREERYPLVLMNGEVFVRCHENANRESVKLLEKYKLEAFLDPVTTWLDYVNEENIRKGWRERNYDLLKDSLIKRAYMNFVERSLFRPFRGYLKGREFHLPYRFVRLVDKDMIYCSEATGEGSINIGQTYAFLKGDLEVDGIYHVGPFGCMQESVATSRIQALRQEYRDKAQTPKDKIIPFMDAVFGESEHSSLEPMIAVFAQQCYLRRSLMKGRK